MRRSPHIDRRNTAHHAAFAALVCCVLFTRSAAAQEDSFGLDSADEGEANATLPSASDAPEESAIDASASVADPEPRVATIPSSPSAPRESKADSERVLKLHIGAGVGVGTLSFERPTPAGVQVLRETPFGAAELFVRTHIWPRAPLSLDVLLAYQSSFGLVMQLQPLFALPQHVDVRWQRGELSVAPVVRLGTASNALALAFPFGFAFQSLSPSVHAFSVKSFSLGGPNLRAELRMALGELVALRVGPEAQWIVLIDSRLRRDGACCQGFAVGAQAAIEARVGPIVRASIAYRQAHAFVPAGAWRFKNVERFLTARLSGEI